MKRKLLNIIIILGIMSGLLIAKDSPEAGKGKIFYNSQDYENAIESFEKAVEDDKENSDLHLWLAKSYLANINNVNFFSKGMYSSDIRKHLKLSIEKDPKNIEAYQYLASYYFNAPAIGGGDKDEAWRLADEIAKLSPAEGNQIKGQFYIQEQEFDKALKEYKELIKLNPEDAHAYYLIGILYQQTKDFDKALLSFEDAIKIDPNALESLYQIGRNAVFSGKNADKGIESLNEYIKHEPDKSLPQHDSAYWRLAALYKMNNNNVKAKEMINKAITLNPENEEYKKLLKELN